MDESLYGPDRIVKNQALIYKSDIRKVEEINSFLDNLKNKDIDI